MRNFMGVAKAITAATLVLQVLTGCATRYCGGCDSTTKKPDETAQHNARTLEIAIDNAAERLVKTLEASKRPDGTLVNGFNRADTISAIQNHITQKLPAPKVLLGENDCVKKYVVQSTVWGLDASLRGTKQTSPATNRSTVFGNTWANITLMCGVKDTARYQNAVQEGWNGTAEILNKLNFDYKPQ